MQKVKDLKSLEKFSKLYKDYKILNFDYKNQEDFENNTKLILSSLSHLTPITEEFDNTIPTSQITFQVVTEGFVTEKEYTDVQQNIKRWKELTKLSSGSEQVTRMLSWLTGSH